MDKELKVAQHFDAPLEHVGGAIERFVAADASWEPSVVDREGGTLVLMLRSGWAPWVDRVAIELETGAPGTTNLRLLLERSLPLSREAPRRRHIAALLAEVAKLVAR
jgi:hypothetical protein